ncbi:MAG: DUF481 domain-containing protein [Phaeodactylibacter sp.]|nr:DUF481 domain-containing protein [Phaeodactylibacter sp.]
MQRTPAKAGAGSGGPLSSCTKTSTDLIHHQSFYQPSLQRGDNYRWRADLGLELPLSKFLNFRMNYLATFESIVAEVQKQEDRLLTFGFTLKNY